MRNSNALSHGGYRRRYADLRTWQGKLQLHIEAALVAMIGGEPTAGEILLIQRAAVLSIRCACLESVLLRKNGDVSEATERRYLRFARSLRDYLQTLGLERRAKDIDLQTYLAQKEAEQ